MKNLLLLAVAIAGGYHFYTTQFTTGASSFDAQGKPQLIIFTIDKCKPCDAALSVLKKRDIPYVNHVVSNGIKEQELFKQYEGKTVPYLIGGDHQLIGADKFSTISFIAEVFGEEVLTAKEQRLLGKHFDADGNPMAVMYGTPRCGYCTKMREVFEGEGVSFTELNVDRDAKAKYAFNALEGNGTPLTYIGYHRINGYNKKKLKSAIKKYNL